MEKRKDMAKKEADKFVDDVNARKDSKKGPTQVEVKPEVVKDIPNDMGRHGSDQEKELNPEE